MKLNVELLETLKCELCNWKSFDEAQLQHKMRAFEKFPRAEYSTFYKPILTNECLMNSLVELGEAFLPILIFFVMWFPVWDISFVDMVMFPLPLFFACLHERQQTKKPVTMCLYTYLLFHNFPPGHTVGTIFSQCQRLLQESSR